MPPAFPTTKEPQPQDKDIQGIEQPHNIGGKLHSLTWSQLVGLLCLEYEFDDKDCAMQARWHDTHPHSDMCTSIGYMLLQ